MYSFSFLFLLFFHDFARGYDFTVRENGLQLDQPPEIGNISVVQIIIMKNDNAEGIIEFDPRHTAFEGKFSNLTNLTLLSELQSTWAGHCQLEFPRVSVLSFLCV